MTNSEPGSDSTQHDDRNTASLPTDSPAWHAIQPASLEEAAEVFHRYPAELTRLIDAGYLHPDASGTSQVLDINELQCFYKAPLLEPGAASRGFVSRHAGSEFLSKREAAIHLRLSLGSLSAISGAVIRVGGTRRNPVFMRSDLDAYLGVRDLSDVAPTAGERVSFTHTSEPVIVAQEADDADQTWVLDDEEYFRSMTTTTSDPDSDGSGLPPE